MKQNIREEVVTQYLLDHPEYVKNNLTLFLQDKFKTVLENEDLSLSNYQVNQFYKQYKTTHTQFTELIETLAKNYQAQQQIHRFIIKLLKQKEIQEVIDLTRRSAKSIFNLAEAKLIIWQHSSLSKPQQQQIKRYLNKSSVYFGTMAVADKLPLFKNKTKTVALIPLIRINYGLLAFGANDDYFVADMANSVLIKFCASMIEQHIKNLNNIKQNEASH